MPLPPPRDACVIDGRRYVLSKQVARNVGLCVNYITRMCREGSVEGRLIDHRWYISEESLDAFLHKLSERKATWHRSLSAERKINYQRSADLRPAPRSPEKCPHCGGPLPSDRAPARHA